MSAEYASCDVESRASWNNMSDREPDVPQKTGRPTSRGRKKRLLIDVITCDGQATPMFLFQEYSFMNEDLKNDVNRYCMDRGWIPFIDYDSDLGGWIFHSISHGDLIWKKPIAKKYEGMDECEVGGEAKLEREFSAHLQSLGLKVWNQVRCDSGVADIVTENKIYELKFKLDRTSFFQAVGQVLLYRQSINPSAEAVLVCRISIVPELHTIAKRIGVEVLVWRKTNVSSPHIDTSEN